MISGTAIDRLSRLKAFPYDRFKIYSFVPIVSMELNSIQAIVVVPIVRVVCDRPGSFSIWPSRSLRRLGRSGRSGRLYENRALYPPKLSFDTRISRWCVPLTRTEYLQLLIGSLINLSCAFCNASVLMCFTMTLETVSKIKCKICRS